MAWVRVASVEALPAGRLLQVEANGLEVVLANDGGTIRAFDGLCPHRQGPLGHGNLLDGRIVCPWHAWEFRCETGAYDYDPSIRLGMFPVEVREDGIWVNA
jgi:nitrite reductase/ring-hydroxylating ferredoxin subunit